MRFYTRAFFGWSFFASAFLPWNPNFLSARNGQSGRRIEVGGGSWIGGGGILPTQGGGEGRVTHSMSEPHAVQISYAKFPFPPTLSPCMRTYLRIYLYFYIYRYMHTYSYIIYADMPTCWFVCLILWSCILAVILLNCDFTFRLIYTLFF